MDEIDRRKPETITIVVFLSLSNWRVEFYLLVCCIFLQNILDDATCQTIAIFVFERLIFIVKRVNYHEIKVINPFKFLKHWNISKKRSFYCHFRTNLNRFKFFHFLPVSDCFERLFYMLLRMEISKTAL